MSDPDVRSQVSEAYDAALRRAQSGGSGCCGPSSSPCGGAYGEAGERHRDAAATSFGCGNPLAFSEVEAGQTVLDLGSGAGLDLLIAAERVGPGGRVLGVDMTPAMLEAARANVARAGLANVELRQGYIEELPVAAGSVDWVISNCVINLSPDKSRVFREIARVLRPGGRFRISDMVVDELPPALRRSAEAYAACVAGAISKEEYLAGLRAAGLEDVRAAEESVYTEEQLRAIASADLGGLPDGLLAAAAGKVASVLFTGRKPAR